jgi:hypothetical protein
MLHVVFIEGHQMRKIKTLIERQVSSPTLWAIGQSPTHSRFEYSLLAAYWTFREKTTLYMITSSYTLDLYMM